MLTVNWDAFTPYPALFGGLLIGLSAVMLILLTGRVAGISGIVGGLMKPQRGETLWRLTFVLGMVAAPWLYQATVGSFEFESPRGTAALVVAGLLVGYGTRLGSGCTSGHGVCGLSRLSLRSLVATCVFMAAGFVVASVVMHSI
ncbi:MAG: YeeE/YedE family protein [Pseudomonadota bacterium]